VSVFLLALRAVADAIFEAGLRPPNEGVLRSLCFIKAVFYPAGSDALHDCRHGPRASCLRCRPAGATRRPSCRRRAKKSGIRGKLLDLAACRSLHKPGRSSLPREQLWHRNVEGCSQYFKRTERDIPFAAFDRSNVSPVQATRIGKLLLRDIELCSICANVAGKDPSELRSRFTHCKLHPRLLPESCELADDESTDYK
jgi:hypothetical protein